MRCLRNPLLQQRLPLQPPSQPPPAAAAARRLPLQWLARLLQVTQAVTCLAKCLRLLQFNPLCPQHPSLSLHLCMLYQGPVP